MICWPCRKHWKDEKNLGVESVHWVRLVQVLDGLSGRVNIVINFQISYMVENFFTIKAAVSFSKRPLFQTVILHKKSVCFFTRG